MPNVLIRDVPNDDLEQIRASAHARGISLQASLREVVHAQAAYLRRSAALARVEERLRGQRAVSTEERRAVLDAIDDAHGERADELSNRNTRDR